MGKPHGADATGQPVDLIGKPMHLRLAPPPSVGVTFITENQTMTKAQADGIYTLNGGRFQIRKGDLLPDGAVMDDIDEADEPTAEVTDAPAKRSKGSAPENRAKADEAEKR
jgi:hypothetical protein